MTDQTPAELQSVTLYNPYRLTNDGETSFLVRGRHAAWRTGDVFYSNDGGQTYYKVHVYGVEADINNDQERSTKKFYVDLAFDTSDGEHHSGPLTLSGYFTGRIESGKWGRTDYRVTKHEGHLEVAVRPLSKPQMVWMRLATTQDATRPSIIVHAERYANDRRRCRVSFIGQPELNGSQWSADDVYELGRESQYIRRLDEANSRYVGTPLYVPSMTFVGIDPEHQFCRLGDQRLWGVQSDDTYDVGFDADGCATLIDKEPADTDS